MGQVRIGPNAAAALAIVAMAAAGCALAPGSDDPAIMTPELIQQLQAQGTTPGTVTPAMLRQDGLMKNGLLPEQWGDTN